MEGHATQPNTNRGEPEEVGAHANHTHAANIVAAHQPSTLCVTLLKCVRNFIRNDDCVENRTEEKFDTMFSEYRTLRPTLMGAFRILFCNNFSISNEFFFFLYHAVDGHKTHGCVEEEQKEAFKIIAK